MNMVALRLTAPPGAMARLPTVVEPPLMFTFPVFQTGREPVTARVPELMVTVPVPPEPAPVPPT
jgi:hypothetical protein